MAVKSSEVAEVRRRKAEEHEVAEIKVVFQGMSGQVREMLLSVN